MTPTLRRAGAVIAILAACDENVDSRAIGNRSFIDACRDPSTCRLSGSARRAEGITDDTISLRLGPGAGAIAVTTGARPTDVAGVLLRGSGRFRTCPAPIDRTTPTFTPDAGACERRDAPADYSWIDLEMADVVTIAVDDDGSTLEILDATSSSTSGCNGP